MKNTTNKNIKSKDKEVASLEVKNNNLEEELKNLKNENMNIEEELCFSIFNVFISTR